jgi:biopolymer transport protein ExbD
MGFSKGKVSVTEMDMTPMIDMTFQLIAFFMMLINFSEGEQNERIQLPGSELAKPALAPHESPITLHLTEDGTVLIAGEEVSISGLNPYLSREADVLRLQGKKLSDATIIIRGDADAKTGNAQDLIIACQRNRFEKFVLRAKEEVGY